MPSTYLSLHHHLVFSTTVRGPFVAPEWRARLHDHLCAAIHGLGGFPEGIGGVTDHVHLLAGLKEIGARGIERILEACRAARTPAPKLRYEPSGLWVEFALPPGEVVRLGGKLDEKLDENRAAIIRAITADPKVTVVQLARQLGLSTSAVENNLRYLKTQKLIARIGPAKGGFWQVNEAKP